MRPILFTLTAICLLTACGSKPAPPAASKTASPAAAAIPAKASAAEVNGARFSGRIGQLEDGGQFGKFIGDHENQAVTLDLQFPADSFQGGEDGPISFFVIFEECENLAPGQKPNQTACSGTEYNVPKANAADHPIVEEGNVWRLRGQFKVVNAGGPLQGLMAVRLEPVPR